MIVVTGATGLLGGAVVERLLGTVPATEIGVSVRDPRKATALADRGVRVRRGDYDDAASLVHAFAGADQLLLVSAPATGETALRQHRTAIDAARRAGVRRVVYTSHMGANPASAFAPMVDHAATEALLADSGLAFTALRNGFYAASGRMLLGRAVETGEVAAPADGPVSWTAHDDLADTAAIVLADEGRFEGATPPLTGSAAVDLAGLAAVAAELTGRSITRTVVTDAQYRERLGPAAELLLGMFAASRAGEFAAVDPTLGELLGRPPLTVRDVLAKD
jgi:NAD(P)H dehydrogenase (quinone)